MGAVSFKSGDTVVLKSGGPKMTIIGKDNRRGLSEKWYVQWLNSEGKLENDYIISDALELAESHNLKNIKLFKDQGLERFILTTVVEALNENTELRQTIAELFEELNWRK